MVRFIKKNSLLLLITIFTMQVGGVNATYLWAPPLQFNPASTFSRTHHNHNLEELFDYTEDKVSSTLYGNDITQQFSVYIQKQIAVYPARISHPYININYVKTIIPKIHDDAVTEQLLLTQTLPKLRSMYNQLNSLYKLTDPNKVLLLNRARLIEPFWLEQQKITFELDMTYGGGEEGIKIIIGIDLSEADKIHINFVESINSRELNHFGLPPIKDVVATRDFLFSAIKETFDFLLNPQDLATMSTNEVVQFNLD